LIPPSIPIVDLFLAKPALNSRRQPGISGSVRTPPSKKNHPILVLGLGPVLLAAAVGCNGLLAHLAALLARCGLGGGGGGLVAAVLAAALRAGDKIGGGGLRCSWAVNLMVTATSEPCTCSAPLSHTLLRLTALTSSAMLGPASGFGARGAATGSGGAS
jgi:hypothetical protein